MAMTTQLKQSENSEQPSEINKHLDKGERFGFMKRGKASRCKTGCRITPEDTRVYDNKSKEGPVCVPCAYKRLKDAAPSEDLKLIMAGLESLSLKVDKLMTMAIPAKPRSIEATHNFDPPREAPPSGPPRHCADCVEVHAPVMCPSRPQGVR